MEAGTLDLQAWLAARRRDAEWEREWEDLSWHCLRVASRYIRKSRDAEDVAQEALLRGWDRRATLRDGSRRRQWLGTIARNEALRFLTSVRPEPVDTLEHSQGAEDARVLSTVERLDLQAAIARLNDRDRRLVWLRYGEDLSQEGIAKRLVVPLGTVKVRLHRVRAKLRRQLEAG